MLDSPGVIKGVIARLPKRTRDKLVEILCEQNLHMPSFDFMLDFVAKQLDMVSHPIMRMEADNRQRNKKRDMVNITETSNLRRSELTRYSRKVEVLQHFCSSFAFLIYTAVGVVV